MMRNRWVSLMCGGLMFTLVACSTDAQPPPAETAEAEAAAPGGYRVVTVAEGLEHPWATASLPDGSILITERPGRLRIVRDGVLEPEPIAGVPEVWAQGQGGLMEVELHPDFESNQLVYMSLAKPSEDGSQATTAIIRGRLDGDSLMDVEEIFEAEAWSGGGAHFAGRIAFDPDGYLFVTVGDRGADPFLLEDQPAQQLTNHQGTVIRLHDDGTVPEDNPFVGRPDALPEIWSYGHRNLQGLFIHPETAEVWQTEHGPQGGDELNVSLPGRNYGWPVIGYGVNYGGAEIHESTSREGMEQPVHYWVPSIGASGLLFYTGDAFPEWQGNAFVGGLSGRYLSRLELDGQSFVAEERLLDGERVRDVQQGRDGLIYVAIDDRDGGLTSIVRLEPEG